MSRSVSRSQRRKNRKSKQPPAPIKNSAQAVSAKQPNTQITSVSVSHTSEERFYSPLPPPAYLRQYDEMAPGSARMIIEAGARQTNHRIELENTVIPAQVRRANYGLLCAFLLGLLGIGGGIAIALIVPTQAGTITGGVLSGTTLVGLATVFIYGTNSQRNERVEKAKDNP